MNTLKSAQRLAKEIPGFEHLSEKILNSSSKVCQKMAELSSDDGKSFMSLCHNDIWMNNVMYCHDESGKPTDALICDFQGPARYPVVMDVIGHLYSSQNEAVKDRDFDILVQHYHNELSTTLKKLNYPTRIPTLTDIQIEVLEKTACFTGKTLMCPGARCLENTGQDVTTFFGDNLDVAEQNYRMMANPKCRKIIEFFLDFFDRKGYFD